MSKTDPNGPVTGFSIPGDEKAGWLPESYLGLTKLEHFASIAKDDFSEFSRSLQIDIVGRQPVMYTDGIGNYRNSLHIDHLKWIAEGRAKWKLMQAVALIEELNRED